MYKLVIFDMDGTILNTLEDLTDSMNVSLREYGLPERRIDEIRKFVGNGLHKLTERSVPEGTSDEMIEGVFNYLFTYYREHCDIKTKPYDGVIELIKRLRDAGCKTAVISNKADGAVNALCESYFDGLFDIAVGDRPGKAKKPAPDSVDEVLSKLGFSRDEAVYVGDSDVDLETARNAHMDCISVSWGFRDKEFLLSKGATTIIDRPEEADEIILK